MTAIGDITDCDELTGCRPSPRSTIASPNRPGRSSGHRRSGQRVREVVGSAGLVARSLGDEFAIVVDPGVDAEAVASAILARLAKRFEDADVLARPQDDARRQGSGRDRYVVAMGPDPGNVIAQ